MAQSEHFVPSFRLGDWLIQPDLNRMTGQDMPAVQVEPRVMQVLLVLAARPGKVVTRQSLLDEVWGEAVVGEENLTRAISELRRIFGDKARTPRYIETIRNHGYRLIAAVGAEAAPAAVAAPAPVTEPVRPVVPPVPATALRPAGRRWPWLLAGVVLVVVLGMWGISKWWIGQGIAVHNNRAVVTATPGPAVPLTSFPGREWHPALSADGQRTVFVWAGPAGDNPDIYLKQRNSESPLRLTDDPGWAAWPAWSPDDLTIAFVRGADDRGSEICTVPSLGGAVRVLYTVNSWVEGLTWGVAGDHLLFSARGDQNGVFKLWRLSLSQLKVTAYPMGRPDNAGDYLPHYAPDGRALAWVGLGQAGGSCLYVRTGDGPARCVFNSPGGLRGLAFTPDGSHLVFAADLAGTFNLYRLPVGSGQADPIAIPTPGELAWNPSIATGTGDLAYEQVRANRDIWQVRIMGQDPWQLETTPLLRSTRWEYEAAFDPTGRQVAFVSARSGQPEIWIADQAGQNLRQLTFAGAAGVSNPRWSPDGSTIAYNTVAKGHSRVMLVEAGGTRPRPVSENGPAEIFSNWSRDGQSLLVAVDGGDGWQINRRSLGTGALTPLTSGGGLTASESPAGDVLYFTRPGQGGLWRRKLSAPLREEPELVISGLVGRDRFNWVVLDKRILWVMRRSGSSILSFYDLETQMSLPLTELPGLAGSGLAISPDEQVILYARTTEMAGDLMLIPAGK